MREDCMAWTIVFLRFGCHWNRLYMRLWDVMWLSEILAYLWKFCLCLGFSISLVVLNSTYLQLSLVNDGSNASTSPEKTEN